MAGRAAASPDPRFQAFGSDRGDNTNAAYSGEFDARARARRTSTPPARCSTASGTSAGWPGPGSRMAPCTGCAAAGGAATAAALRAEAHARAAGDDALAASCAAGQRSQAFGPAHVDEAIGRWQAMLAEADGAWTLGRDAQRHVGKLLAMRGEHRGGARARASGDRGQPRGRSARRGGRPARRPSRSSRFARATTRPPRGALRPGIAELDRLGNRSYRGTTALMLADLLADTGRVRGGGALVRRRTRDAERRRPRRRHRCRRAARGSSRAAAGCARRGRATLGPRGRRSPRTIDMYESKARALRVARPHARARRQAARGTRGGCDRARDLRGQGGRPRERLGARAARLAVRLTRGRLGWRQRNGELGHDRAERVAQRAADPQNLIWVMPAEVCAWRSRPSSSLPEGIPPLVACPSCRRVHT